MSWVLIDGMVNQRIVAHQEWQIDDPDDLLDPPEAERYAAPGSKAWTADYQYIFNKDNNGEWVDIINGGSALHSNGMPFAPKNPPDGYTV